MAAPLVTPGTGLLSKRTQLTGPWYQWTDPSAARASGSFVFFPSPIALILLFFTLPHYFPAVIPAADRVSSPPSPYPQARVWTAAMAVNWMC